MSRDIILPSGLVLKSEKLRTPVKKDNFPPEKWEKAHALMRAGVVMYQRPEKCDRIIIADDSPFSSREKLQEFVGGPEITEPTWGEVSEHFPNSGKKVRYCGMSWDQYFHAYKYTDGQAIRIIIREGESEKTRTAWLAESLRETERVV